MSSDLNEILEELTQKIGGTKSDVLRGCDHFNVNYGNSLPQAKKFGIAEPEPPLATEIIIP